MNSNVEFRPSPFTVISCHIWHVVRSQRTMNDMRSQPSIKDIFDVHLICGNNVLVGPLTGGGRLALECWEIGKGKNSWILGVIFQCYPNHEIWAHVSWRLFEWVFATDGEPRHRCSLKEIADMNLEIWNFLQCRCKTDIAEWKFTEGPCCQDYGLFIRGQAPKIPIVSAGILWNLAQW